VAVAEGYGVMENSKIEWCDHTFNPWIGCTKVSEGCLNCYAETQNRRYRWVDEWGVDGMRKQTSEHYWSEPLRWNRKAEREGKRYKVFCGSLCDIFEDNEQVALARKELFELIQITTNLDWLLLTKRPKNIYGMWPRNVFGEEMRYPNVWLGTTVENEDQLGRIEYLTDVNSVIYWLSIEPMLGPIDLGKYANWIDWVICGGESGLGFRPFSVIYARDLLAQCRYKNIPFFMKQLGGYPDKKDKLEDFPTDLQVREFPCPPK
jgi:protein gp37